MADEDVKLGTVDPNSPAAAPDMNRYYYPPGTTEPVLRPEFANESASEPAAASEEVKPLKGKLPDDFPGYSALEAAGLTTYAKVRKEMAAEKPFSEVDGIGPATADKIREAMGESSEADEEPE